ncbi:hypothetical protein AHMF7605_05545 [Adhaeribacter arboris]|uniref:Uncharacterized protein n=1 Tax=Adhaeribacter arboris TaxID=2072846 RepID=A0A2T2YC56_9BACT|nr:hypothetical protein [Adhaeribacter arboris]PSR53028.1 hypothetical protein AHMF7605_05545 [Adhaeribacter arboris]
MTYKGASLLVLFWGIINLIGAGMAYYFMGSFAQAIAIQGLLSGILGFSIGHFLNRGRKQAFILALASCLICVFLLGQLTTNAFNQEPNLFFSDALATQPQDISLLVTSAMLTFTVLVLLLLLIFARSIYVSFRNEV